jgi:hypothetical protein
MPSRTSAGLRSRKAAEYGSDAVRKPDPEQKKDEDEEAVGKPELEQKKDEDESDWANAMNDEWLQGGTTTADAGIAM